MYPLEGKFYSVSLRGKAGEFLACRDLDDPRKEHLLPQFIVPPLSAPENNALPSDQAIEDLIVKITDHWGTRPCLLDLRFLSFDADHGIDASWVNQLLMRARAARCRVVPTIDLNSDFYRIAAIGAHARKAKSGVALRLTLNDLSQPELRQLIDTQLTNLHIPSNDCLVVLDLTDAHLSQHDEFAKFTSEWLFKLHSFGTWPRIIFQATSFPRRNPASANNQHRVERAEWLIWQRILQLDAKIKDFVIFGDFGADNAHIDFSSGGRAITHLRYATETDWLVARGDDDWQSIRSVARSIVKSGAFCGELFSAGDEFIGSRARGLAGVGSPMIWRSVNMNHHMSLAVSRLGSLYGIPIPELTKRRKPVQEELFTQPHASATSK